MRATITFDENNYIKRFLTDINGEYEIDEKTFEFDFMFCYHLLDDELVLDEEKKAEQISEDAKQEEITDLKQKLNETDYIIARTYEDVMALNNPLTFVADIIKILLQYRTKYAEALANRKAWRERIEELENAKTTN